jgi:hypothetical protein
MNNTGRTFKVNNFKMDHKDVFLWYLICIQKNEKNI